MMRRAWRPTPQQELLLRAALGHGPDALNAWQAWRASASLSHLDLGSLRLLPLLDANLRRLGVEPIPDMIAATCKNTWFANQLLAHEGAKLMTALESSGISTMVLKGAALATLYYRDLASRPMADIDLLVPRDQAVAAMARMHELNWRSGYASPEALVVYQHSAEFRNPHDGTCDLHWRVLSEGRPDVSDNDFWTRKQPVTLGSVRSSTLGPADQLLHICIHAAAWSVTPSIQWIADAIVMLRSEPAIQWDILLTETQKRGLTLAMTEMLQYLRDVMNSPIPDEVLTTLRRMPPSTVDQVAYLLRSGPMRLTPPLATAIRWARASRSPGHSRRSGEFLRYLTVLWTLDHAGQIPGYLARRGATAVTRAVSTGTRRT